MPRFDAELQQRFAREGAAIAYQTAKTAITPALAANAVVRVASAPIGAWINRFAVLTNIFRAEEAASSILGGVRIAVFTEPNPQEAPP